MAIALKSPRVVVALETPTPGEYLEYTVQTDNRDAVQWDFVRARKAWPQGKDAPLLWMTFLAWNALRRSGAPVTDSFDTFANECVAVQPVDEDGNDLTAGSEVATVDPTIPEPAPA
jgi:hypothetical protein